MDKTSKKSSFTSNSVYMSANEMEMDDMSNPESSKLLKNSDSKQETIDEEKVNEERREVITLRAGESEAPVVDQEREHDIDDEEDASAPLLDQTSPVQAPNESATSSQETVKLVDEEVDVEQMEIEEPVMSPTFGPENLLERFREAYADYGIFIIGGTLLLMAFFFTIFVLPKCFYSLYYDEYALARSTLTGSVDDTEVYGPGWHIMAPWYEWIKFYKTVHTISLNKLDIYSTDQLKVQGSFLIYYFLDKNKLGQLYRNHGTNYQKVIHNVCKSEILNQAQTFAINDYRRKRPEIKEFIKEKVRDKLEKNYGLKLFNLYMNELVFDKSINEINLKNVLNSVLNEKAVYDKNTAIAEVETQRLVKEYNNLARIVYVGATLNGTYEIIKPANVEYDQVLQMALSESLVESFEGLSMGDDKIKMSFNWMSSLVYNPKIRFYQLNTSDKASTNQGPYSSRNPISIIV